MSVNHQTQHDRDNAIEQHDNPAAVLSHLERAVNVENTFDDQIDSEDQHDEVQPGAGTIEQSQSRADSNQCENCVEPARSDVFVKDGD